MFQIATPRLCLRPVRAGDAAAILEGLKCPSVREMYVGLETLDEVQDYIGVLGREYAAGQYKTLAIAGAQGDRLVGMISLEETPFSRAEVSYWIDRGHRNRGYATEAVRAMISHCFTARGVNRVQAMTFNPASARVLQKAGMRPEGTLRQYMTWQGKTHDFDMYAAIRSDFENKGE